MRAVWRELPEACDNTLLIAERCEVEFDEGADLMPRFAVPEGHTEETWLRAEVESGLRDRFPAGVPAEHRERAAYELGVIGQMGFPGYFLVVADLCRHARESGIRRRAGPRLGGRLAGRLRAAASPSSTRSSTACCSSGSSTPSACRCPTSTSTSTSAGAAT